MKKLKEWLCSKIGHWWGRTIITPEKWNDREDTYCKRCGKHLHRQIRWYD